MRIFCFVALLQKSSFSCRGLQMLQLTFTGWPLLFQGTCVYIFQGIVYICTYVIVYVRVRISIYTCTLCVYTCTLYIRV